MEIIGALKEAVDILKKNNISEPVLKARILLADLLNIRKEELIINEHKTLNANFEKKYKDNIKKICEHMPVQYITKKQEFMGFTFEVNENVLIPRADTEILVEEALKHAKGDVLELCTGSGAICVSMAKLCKSKLTATDISPEALKLASKNAEKNGVNINFIESDLFNNVCGKYDLIVANPPYIETDVIETLDEQVKKEPRIALDGGRDGLNFYRRISKEAWKFMKPNAFLCMEIGYTQQKAVTEILTNIYNNIHCVKDLSGNDRVIVCSLERK